MAFDHVPVQSSAIASVAYDGYGTLEVKLTNGRTYRYGGVSPEKHIEFMTAESPGKFYNTEIKGKHAAVDADAPPPPTDEDLS